MSLFKAIAVGAFDCTRYWLAMNYSRKHFELGHKLLEVGCDDGAFALGFCLAGYDVLALDPEVTPYLGHLYTFKRMTLHDWSRQAGQLGKGFDMVHLGQVLEHVEDPDEMMEQACEACRGKLIVSVPAFNWTGHLRTYTKDQAVKFLEQYMTIDEVHEIKDPLYDSIQTLVFGGPK